jgi:hypothetical protein
LLAWGFHSATDGAGKFTAAKKAGKHKSTVAKTVGKHKLSARKLQTKPLSSAMRQKQVRELPASARLELLRGCFHTFDVRRFGLGGRSGEMADAQDLKIHFGRFQAITPHHLPHALNH